jgi:Fe-Mn family superoxide dismutase
MDTISRRTAIRTLIGGGAGLGLARTTRTYAEPMQDSQQRTTANAQSVSAAGVARAFRGEHQVQPLPFDPAKLRGLSERLIRSQWENNYGGAVKALNTVEQRLARMLTEADLPAYVYGDLKREELVRTGSVVLHENYFANLGGDGMAGGKVFDLIKQWFGSYEQWEADFKKTAGALGGGSGWTILAYNFHTGEMHNYWSWDHMHNAPMSRPLLVLDMYEHAYHMDYGAAAAKYVEAFMQNVTWEEVNRRAEAAVKASLV